MRIAASALAISRRSIEAIRRLNGLKVGARPKEPVLDILIPWIVGGSGSLRC